MKKVSLASASWQFRETSSKTWLPAKVPGCVHTDLIAAGKIPDPFFGTNELSLRWIEDKDWEYRARFPVGADLLNEERCELVSDGLDTVAAVFVNGEKVGESDNMFVGHRWDIKPQLHRGQNELRIIFYSAMDYVRKRRPEFTPPREFCDPVGNGVRIRKQPCQFGWDWGPRLVTAGIWRDLRIESGPLARLEHAKIEQVHRADGSVVLKIVPEFSGRTDYLKSSAICRLNGAEIARAEGADGEMILLILKPQLWWPAGQGDQPLYDLEISAVDSELVDRGKINKRIGLRSIKLDRHADEWGESFQIVVNGRPIFAKGANWVPAHSFVTTLTRSDYARDLEAAVEANMNCLRLWGGGIYESEDFYDLCDELGLMLWHDFMFSCALYPSDEDFLESSRAEAIYQVRRIHHRASLALWCGNNELAQLNAKDLRENPKLLAGYEKLFHQIIPEVLATHDGMTSYWPSSEWRGTYESGHALGEKSGDSHYWDVWHSRHPVKDYEKWAFRFCSEFGMQSYSSPETNATFCPPDDINIFGPSMENHQKNRLGNQVILDYVSRRYRLPKSQDDLIYLSQLNQAYCMQVGVEHYRRLTPRCMGALYWQLNDCWPVASWSSIEFTGRWKALHHVARRFNAPALVTAHVPGDESTRLGNYRESTVREVFIYTVYDAPQKQKGVLRWDLFHLDGRKLLSGKKTVMLKSGTSVKQVSLDLLKELSVHGRDHLYLRIGLEIEEQWVSNQAVFFAPPRFISLPKKTETRISVSMINQKEAEIIFESAAFQHAFYFDLKGLQYKSSDNYFDLFPGQPKKVIVSSKGPMTRQRITASLVHRSLADTYD